MDWLSIHTPQNAGRSKRQATTWAGSPIRTQHLTLATRGYPFLIGFVDGDPRIILNKILVEEPGNLERVYANEWTRPWVIAEILDATGFNTEKLVVATMKASEADYVDAGLEYLRNVAQLAVEAFVDEGDRNLLTPKQPGVWTPDWQHENVTLQLLQYETDWSLVNAIGHGDSIRELVELFQGDRTPKGTPPDRGETLEQVLVKKA